MAQVSERRFHRKGGIVKKVGEAGCEDGVVELAEE